jgi:precorrin-6A/cobalt-precorrin-6A reductase
MIFILGGTSETATVAQSLAQAGFDVVVSTATDVPLEIGQHPRLHRRSGKLDHAGMVELLRGRNARAVVDVSHPYAASVRSTARAAAEEIGIPYLSWTRPGCVEPAEFISFASDHEDAARIACAFAQPVLLTTGSRNLAAYVQEATRRQVELVARVLDDPQSLQACLNAGIAENRILRGRGPFSVEDNLAAIQRFSIGVLVTKDSGIAGGVREKMEAARVAGCRVVVVERPPASTSSTLGSMEEVIQAVSRLVAGRK